MDQAQEDKRQEIEVCSCVRVRVRPLLSAGRGQGGFLVRSLVDGAGSYSVTHRAGLLPTELTGMWGWILLRSPHQGRGSSPAPAPTKQRPGACACRQNRARGPLRLWERGALRADVN